MADNLVDLYKFGEGVYGLVIPNALMRANVFMRFQEFYESPSELFRDKSFTIKSYIAWYLLEFETDKFDYGERWAGYNIPSEAIVACLRDIKDENEFDAIMRDVACSIYERKFYLIGTEAAELSHILDHEYAHAMYYLNKKYKSKMDKLVEGLPGNVLEEMGNILLEMGYTEKVLFDEIQAYLSTGVCFELNAFKEYAGPFEKVYNKYRGDFKPEFIRNVCGADE